MDLLPDLGIRRVSSDPEHLSVFFFCFFFQQDLTTSYSIRYNFAIYVVYSWY